MEKEREKGVEGWGDRQRLPTSGRAQAHAALSALESWSCRGQAKAPSPGGSRRDRKRHALLKPRVPVPRPSCTPPGPRRLSPAVSAAPSMLPVV